MLLLLEKTLLYELKNKSKNKKPFLCLVQCYSILLLDEFEDQYHKVPYVPLTLHVI